MDTVAVVGSEVTGADGGIWCFRLDAAAGRRTTMTQSETPGPVTAIVSHPVRPAVFVTSPAHGGIVLGLRLDGDGAARTIATAAVSGGDPCDAALAPNGKLLAVVTYSGSLSLHRAGGTGSVASAHQTVLYEGSGVDPVRQERAHPHGVIVTHDAVIVSLSSSATWAPTDYGSIASTRSRPVPNTPRAFALGRAAVLGTPCCCRTT
jgi:6-phosphogluconolactonase (cycloisomerase 2 family)